MIPIATVSEVYSSLLKQHPKWEYIRIWGVTSMHEHSEASEILMRAGHESRVFKIVSSDEQEVLANVLLLANKLNVNAMARAVALPWVKDLRHWVNEHEIYFKDLKKEHAYLRHINDNIGRCRLETDRIIARRQLTSKRYFSNEDAIRILETS